MTRILALIAALALSQAAWGQSNVLQVGPYTPGHVPIYVGQSGFQPVVADSGSAAGGGQGAGLSELALTVRGTGNPPFAGQGNGPSSTNFCDYDAPTNSGAYHYFCIGPNSGTGVIFNQGAGGTATQQGFTWVINGNTAMSIAANGVVTFPTSINNFVAGSITSRPGVIRNNSYFYSNTTPNNVILNKLNDRLFVGQSATLTTGNSPPGDTWPDLLAPTYTGGFVSTAQAAIISNIGQTALTTAVRTSDLGAAPSSNCCTIATQMMAVCDNTYVSGGASPGCFAEYTETHRYAPGAGALGYELEMINHAGAFTVDTGPWPNSSWFGAGLSNGLRLGSGGQEGIGVGASAALYILNNGANWRKGIIFQNNALDSNVGTGGQGTAIEFGVGQSMRWVDSTNGNTGSAWNSAVPNTPPTLVPNLPATSVHAEVFGYNSDLVLKAYRAVAIQNSSQPAIRIQNLGASTDLGNWIVQDVSNNLRIQAINDAFNTSTDAWVVNRGSGANAAGVLSHEFFTSVASGTANSTLYLDNGQHVVAPGGVIGVTKAGGSSANALNLVAEAVNSYGNGGYVTINGSTNANYSNCAVCIVGNQNIAQFRSVASATNWLIASNSNGGNPSITTSAGAGVTLASGAGNNTVLNDSIVYLAAGGASPTNNGMEFSAVASGSQPLLNAFGTDTNIALQLASKGNKSIDLFTNVSVKQVSILHTASATNVLTLTGGVNPTIGTTGGSLAVTPPAVFASTISATQLTSTISTGTAPFVVASTTNVANLNASSLNGNTFAAPGAIGGTTPAFGTFTTVNVTSGYQAGGVAGVSQTCTVNQTKTLIFTNGILTGGTCNS